MMYLASQLLLLTAPACAMKDGSMGRLIRATRRGGVPPPPPIQSEEKVSYEAGNPHQVALSSEIALQVMSGLKKWLAPLIKIDQIEEIKKDIQRLNAAVLVRGERVEDDVMDALSNARTKCLAKVSEATEQIWTTEQINALGAKGYFPAVALPIAMENLILDFCYGENTYDRHLFEDGFDTNYGFLQGTLADRTGPIMIREANRLYRDWLNNKKALTARTMDGQSQPVQLLEHSPLSSNYSLGKNIDQAASKWHITLRLKFEDTGKAHMRGVPESNAKFLFEGMCHGHRAGDVASNVTNFALNLNSMKSKGYASGRQRPTIEYGRVSRDISDCFPNQRGPDSMKAIDEEVVVTIGLMDGVLCYCNHADPQRGFRYVLNKNPRETANTIKEIKLAMDGFYKVEQLSTPTYIKKAMELTSQLFVETNRAQGQLYVNSNIGVHTVDWQVEMDYVKSRYMKKKN